MRILTQDCLMLSSVPNNSSKMTNQQSFAMIMSLQRRE